MKKLISVICILMLSACATTGTKTPAQIASQVCAPTQSVLAVLKSDTQIAESGQAVITKAAPQIASICSAASSATSSDVTTLTNLAINVVLPVAEATHPELVPDLVAAQAIVGIVEANVPAK